MIDDMKACNLGTATEKSHIRSCRRFTAFLKRSPDRATADDVCAFQRLLPESGISIQQRNVIMTGVKFLLRVTRRRHDLAAEIFYLKQPRKMTLIMSREEVKRLLLMARSLEVRAMLALAYC
jgi:site-specific recombinase XerD